MLARNKSMAEFNLSFQNRLENMKGEVAKHYEDANKLKIDLAQDKSKIGTELTGVFLGSVGGQYKTPFPMVKICVIPNVFRDNSQKAHKY